MKSNHFIRFGTGLAVLLLTLSAHFSATRSIAADPPPPPPPPASPSLPTDKAIDAGLAKLSAADDHFATNAAKVAQALEELGDDANSAGTKSKAETFFATLDERAGDAWNAAFAKLFPSNVEAKRDYAKKIATKLKAVAEKKAAADAAAKAKAEAAAALTDEKLHPLFDSLKSDKKFAQYCRALAAAIGQKPTANVGTIVQAGKKVFSGVDANASRPWLDALRNLESLKPLPADASLQVAAFLSKQSKETAGVFSTAPAVEGDAVDGQVDATAQKIADALLKDSVFLRTPRFGDVCMAFKAELQRLIVRVEQGTYDQDPDGTRFADDARTQLINNVIEKMEADVELKEDWKKLLDKFVGEVKKDKKFGPFDNSVLAWKNIVVEVLAAFDIILDVEKKVIGTNPLTQSGGKSTGGNTTGSTRSSSGGTSWAAVHHERRLAHIHRAHERRSYRIDRIRERY